MHVLTVLYTVHMLECTAHACASVHMLECDAWKCAESTRAPGRSCAASRGRRRAFRPGRRKRKTTLASDVGSSE